MQTLTTTTPDSELRDNLARDIAEALASGNPRFPVRTPAEGLHRRMHTRPVLDVVSEAIGAPDCPILTALLALLAAGLKSGEVAVVGPAVAACNAIVNAHVENQIDAAVQEDVDAVGLFVPAPWSREGRRAAA